MSPRRRPPAWVRTRLLRVAVAMLAGVAAVGGSYAVAGYTRAFLAVPVNAVLTRVTPGAVIAWAITTLGDLGKLLAFGGAVALTVTGVGVLAYAGLLVGRALERPTVGGLGTGVAVATGAYLLTRAAEPALAAGAAAGGVVAVAGHRPRGTTPVSTPRRRLLAATGGAALTAAAGIGLGSRGGGGGRTAPIDDPVVSRLLDTAEARSMDVGGLDPLVSEGHYVVDVASVPPDLSDAEWELSITGEGVTDTTVTLEDVRAAPTEHRFVTLRCVGDPLNGRKVDTALWTGTPVRAVLPDDLPEECCVMLRAEDDYYEEFPLEALEDALLAYRMNGRPLPRDHGHPVRALVPGHWGEINVKWLSEIEVLAEPAEGFWEKRGWHGTGPVNTVAKVHAVESLDGDRVRVAGHAYAGVRGIDRVEVSTDGGDTWADAELSARLPGARAGDGEVLRETAQDAWRMWRHAYTATEPHEVVVRATDGEGTRQDETRAEPYPRGASGWVTRDVDP